MVMVFIFTLNMPLPHVALKDILDNNVVGVNLFIKVVN